MPAHVYVASTCVQNRFVLPAAQAAVPFAVLMHVAPFAAPFGALENVGAHSTDPLDANPLHCALVHV